MLGVAQGVKEDLTQIGTFVVVELPFQHVEKETSTIRINNKQTHGSSVQRERDLVLGALHKSPLKPDPNSQVHPIISLFCRRGKRSSEIL